MKQYGAIYLDAPWSFKVRSDKGKGRSAENHYRTMSLEQLCALPVPQLMAKDCAVFMWATWPNLMDSFVLASCWGLHYSTCGFLWAKTNKRAVGRLTELLMPANWFMGMGYWTRANTEPCLLFTKGTPKRRSKGVRQLVVAPVMEHSRKPDLYGDIERLVDGPYCELFARRKQPGWDSYGNEIDGQDINTVLAFLRESKIERN